MVPTRVAMIDIAQQAQQQYVFMDIVLNGQRYPKQRKGQNRFLKAVAPNPFRVGEMHVEADYIRLFDEQGNIFVDLQRADMQQLTIGLHRAVVRAAMMQLMNMRYVAALTMQTTQGTFYVLNDGVNVLQPLVTALELSGDELRDDMNLCQNWPVLSQLNNDVFESLAAGTAYFTPLQSLGSNQRF
jgi:hypothetical protein